MMKRFSYNNWSSSIISRLTTTALTTAALSLFALSRSVQRVSAFSLAANNNSNKNASKNYISNARQLSERHDDTCSTSSVMMTGSMIQNVQDALINSWPRLLSDETTENYQRSLKYVGGSPSSSSRVFEVDSGGTSSTSNRTKRPVYNGHYVLVRPTGLPKPRLVLVNPSLAEQLHLTSDHLAADEFVQWISGNLVIGSETWATPYALSIMGTPYTNNCPFGTGDGYGDGRAISIGELFGLELQLKGAGQTPFCRGADGRAVLRSSIREYLASEAMYNLNVPTTRALSLVVSEQELIQRPWYTDDAVLAIPISLDNDPRFQQYTEPQRKRILQQLRNQKADPNILIREKAAITCRVASSFLRIGHVDLFARRAVKASTRSASKSGKQFDTTSMEWKELEEIIWHACYREYKDSAYDPFHETRDLASAATVFLDQSAEKLATMVAQWIRVGFAQGNFNGDNCLVGGKTMDYGPFGFMEEYYPLFAKWTGSGSHFGFMNQPNAGYANYQVLVSSVVQVICAAKGIDDMDIVIKGFMDKAAEIFQSKVSEVFRTKLGFLKDQEVADDIWESLEVLMRDSRTDWTILFRQLTYVMRDFATDPMSSMDYEAMFAVVEGDDKQRDGSSAFYDQLSPENRREWLVWIQQWREALVASDTASTAYERMRLSNPKFILREWMLADAYNGAANNDEDELLSLNRLIQNPYDEGSDSDIERYYRRARGEALTTGGIGFMS